MMAGSRSGEERASHAATGSISVAMQRYYELPVHVLVLCGFGGPGNTALSHGGTVSIID